VHTVLGGPGLLESIYEEALCYELQLRGIQVARQVELPVIYKGQKLSKKYRLDVLVENLVVVECKATEEDHSIYEAQCLTNLRLIDKRLGLVINFGQELLKHGIHRVVNHLQER
jgi:GxxExxY protein